MGDIWELKTRKEEFMYRGEKHEFEFRDLTWDEELDIQNEGTTMSTDGTVSIDLKEMSYRMAELAIVKAPFPVTREQLKKLPGPVGRWLEKQTGADSFREERESEPQRGVHIKRREAAHR